MHTQTCIANSKQENHTIRRTDRNWAGLSLDLVTEQLLMQSLKTNGALTRGSGLSELERLVWLFSMPACAEVNVVMQMITGITFATSDQHKDESLKQTRQTNERS